MIAALLLALQAPVAPAFPDQEWALQLPAAMDDWKLCVLGTASGWAGQTAQPSDIAEGAIGHCAPLLVKVEQILRSSRYLKPESADELVAELKATWRERAIAVVLEQRAKPRAKKPG